MRYLPLTTKDREDMLKAIGVSKVQELYSAVPKDFILKDPLNLAKHKSEIEVENYFKALAKKNLGTSGAAVSLLGGGMYRHHIPASVDYIIQRGEFLTSYTPYQPEVSQGTLQALFEYQTQVALLSGMDISNASMYDGSTATTEAIAMALRINKNKDKVIVSGNLHPHYIEVAQTHARFLKWNLNVLKHQIDILEDLESNIDDNTAAIVVQNPDFFGRVRDFSNLSKICKEKGIMLIVVVTEVVSLGLIKSPGAMGADIVAGEGQSLGNPTSFGGPSLGIFATKQEYLRNMPGRVCGETQDSEGKRGYVLTLSTREQHIRREKATSNICTNSGLCALAFSVHASLLGGKGIQHLAKLNHGTAVNLANELTKIKGVKLKTKQFFNEFTIELPMNANEFANKMLSYNIFAGVPLSQFYANSTNDLLVAATELLSKEDIETTVKAFSKVLA